MKFALSTSWNAQRHYSGRAIVSEIKTLGFDEIELNFTLTQDMVNQIGNLQNEGLIDVVGLHNFCPIPEGLLRSEASPEYYSLSALDDEERRRAIQETKRTIDTARELEAKVVIIHAGKVQVDYHPVTLIRLYQRGEKATRFYGMIKKALIEEREFNKGKFLEAAIRSLEELSDYSIKAGVKLAVENRYYSHEIPSLSEMEIILDHFKDSNIFYWHDVGHAQVVENLGLCKHRDYLDRFGNRMIGIHLHDVVGTEDHRAPGTGNFVFKSLRPYLSEGILLVLEPHSPATARQIRKAVKLLEKELTDED